MIVWSRCGIKNQKKKKKKYRKKKRKIESLQSNLILIRFYSQHFVCWYKFENDFGLALFIQYNK